MSRNGSGTYSLPLADVVDGTTIEASWANTTLADIATALTNSVAKDGQTVMTGDLDFNGNSIILDADGDSSITADTDDQIDFEVGGTDAMSVGISDGTGYAFVGNATYDANPVPSDDPHYFEVTNNAGNGNTGKQLIRINSYGDSTYENNVHFCRYYGSAASPAAIENGATLMSIGLRGYDGTALSSSAGAIAVVATEDWDASSHGLKIEFGVTPNGSITRAVKLTLEQDGSLTTNAIGALGLVTCGAACHVKSGTELRLFRTDNLAYTSMVDSGSGTNINNNNGNPVNLQLGGTTKLSATSTGAAVNGDTINVATQKTPASAAAAGTKGDIVHDTNYIYVCTATNTWKRVAISTW